MTTQPKDLSLKSGRTKEQYMKAIMNQEYDDMIAIPEDLVPKGFVYGKADLSWEGRIRQLMGKGWSFVPPSRHPELAFQGIDNVDPRTANMIIMGKNLVLMERSIELHEFEQKQRDIRHSKILNSAPGLENAPYKPSINTQLYTQVGDDYGHDASFG